MLDFLVSFILLPVKNLVRLFKRYYKNYVVINIQEKKERSELWVKEGTLSTIWKPHRPSNSDSLCFGAIKGQFFKKSKS